MLKGKGNSIKHMTRLIMDFSKRPFFRVVLMITIATSVTIMGLISSVSDKAENEDVFNALESKSSITPYKPFISEETINLKSLEKTFMDSDFYRMERMIPLTVSKGTKNFVAYKIRNETMYDI